jgi:hypothetical protein
MANRTEQNLLDLIRNQQEEHLELEFKGAGALAKTEGARTEISKDVSAFANTIGGTILYGIAEAPGPPNAASNIDPTDPNNFTKEWIEQVINSRIHPRISGILIDPIQLPTTTAGRVVYRVYISQSDTAHQAFDNRYYKRFNSQSVPMEDYEVRQAMFRRAKASYKIFPEARTTAVPDGYELRFRVTVLNTTEITGHDCSLLGYLPREFFPGVAAHEFVEVQGVECVRLVGHTGVGLSPGPTNLEIPRGLIVRNTQPNLEAPIPMFFRIYDSFGLALSQRFSLVRTSRVFALEETIDVGRLASTIVP